MESKTMIKVMVLIGLLPFLTYGQGIFDQKVDKIAEKYVNKHKNRSMVIGIIDGETVDVKGYGHVSQLQDFTPNEHTIFEIGELSSVFTTSMLMLEVQKGSFALDESINTYLPSDIRMPVYQPFVCHIETEMGVVAAGHERVRMVCEPDPYQMPLSVSFCDLASHTSGLPNTPHGLNSWNPLRWTGKQSKDPYNAYSRSALYEHLYGYVLSLPPGSFYQYSEAGVALLGNILADYNYKPYAELLRENLTYPLGMFDTDIEVPASKSNRFAGGHDRKGKLTEHWHYEAMAPAAGLRSTAGDMLRFLRANLELGEDPISEAFRQVQQPRIDVPKHKTGRFTMGAYGWFVSLLSEKSNLPITWINGGTGGFRSFMAFNRDRNIAIVILSNSANSVDKIGFEILEHLVEQKDHRFVIESIFDEELNQEKIPEIYFLPVRS
ncbi:MAG: beta-lactamase family protein [Saprospiraceae bacterium]|nr:beta-lactamase family protein [Saprospiraceae bacterium]